ncbi:hypothetical protein RBWH47_04943 [Rhodopirellula baltica WH47]|uniref:Uncharacterized protein n=1 Tax=Rhodopirellula baltica WH47 TaxID=991778 RepID=F2AYY8_RHOBT|nr:hypothetical protein RBWH47_04943 [Rhodopirellula baltica WH47]
MLRSGGRGEELGSSGFVVEETTNGVELAEIQCENLHCLESLCLVGGVNVTGSRTLPRSRVRVASHF